ncbi:hypothetical protein LCGC14_3114870 [marine sediment metagenome]|uniref:Uncharacterized protein n=1 Tax=marine sediment metagenome TaxID=412755 RepID=A0A0F8YTY7_9ZZZZ
MTLVEACTSWLEGEPHLQAMTRYSSELEAELEDLLDALRSPAASTRRKVSATRRLQELTRVAAANAGSTYPGPNVLPYAWQWGRPGSAEDLELREASEISSRRQSGIARRRARRRRRQA